MREVLDPIDLKVLAVISRNPRATITHIAEVTGLARGTVNAHLQRMEGILSPHDRRIPPAALGFPLTAFIQAQISGKPTAELERQLALIPEIVEAFAVSGDWGVHARIVARDPDDLYRVTGLIQDLPGVKRTSVTLAMHALVAPRMRPLLDAAAEAQ